MDMMSPFMTGAHRCAPTSHGVETPLQKFSCRPGRPKKGCHAAPMPTSTPHYRLFWEKPTGLGSHKAWFPATSKDPIAYHYPSKKVKGFFAFHPLPIGFPSHQRPGHGH